MDGQVLSCEANPGEYCLESEYKLTVNVFRVRKQEALLSQDNTRLSFYCVPNSLVGIESAQVSPADECLCLMELRFQVGMRKQERDASSKQSSTYHLTVNHGQKQCRRED